MPDNQIEPTPTPTLTPIPTPTPIPTTTSTPTQSPIPAFIWVNVESTSEESIMDLWVTFESMKTYYSDRCVTAMYHGDCIVNLWNGVEDNPYMIILEYGNSTWTYQGWNLENEYYNTPLIDVLVDAEGKYIKTVQFNEGGD